MSLQAKYIELYPKRQPLNKKGEATKGYLDWLETQHDPFYTKMTASALEDTEKLKEEWGETNKAYHKQVKKNKRMKRDPSLVHIQQMSHPKRVEAFLNQKVKDNG